MPDASKTTNHHGTRCAGEIAAVPNDVCGVGVAFGAKVSGELRCLMTSSETIWAQSTLKILCARYLKKHLS